MAESYEREYNRVLLRLGTLSLPGLSGVRFFVSFSQSCFVMLLVLVGEEDGWCMNDREAASRP
jgi:hypothetical protein